MRVDDHHSFEEGTQASKRSFRALFYLGKSRSEGAVGVVEAQLLLLVVAEHPEAFFGLCHEIVAATSHLEEWRDAFYSMGNRKRPREIFFSRPHPKAAFGVESSAVIQASGYKSHPRYLWDSFEGGRRSREAGGASLPHTALRIKDEGVEASTAQLNQLRALPGNRCGCELLIVVTETELTFTVAAKSQKAPFERRRHSNE